MFLYALEAVELLDTMEHQMFHLKCKTIELVQAISQNDLVAAQNVITQVKNITEDMKNSYQNCFNNAINDEAMQVTVFVMGRTKAILCNALLLAHEASNLI